MSGFTSHTGIAAPIMRDNIDTDQIIPSREMKTVSKLGLGEGLFAGQRYLAPGTRDVNPDFVLNQTDFKGTSILLSGKNFGCGSSREHAVWALKEFGIRVIIAESFGEIFYNNCVRNGIVCIAIAGKDIAALAAHKSLTIDLSTQTITAGGQTTAFDISPTDKTMLIDGLDPIDLTLIQRDDINNFLEQDKKTRPWVYMTA